MLESQNFDNLSQNFSDIQSSQRLREKNFKMKIDDEHIITQKNQKIALRSMQIYPSQFDVEFKSDNHSTKLYQEIVFKNVSNEIISFRIRINNVNNYEIRPNTRILQSKEQKTIQICVNDSQNCNFNKDKIQVQVIILEEDDIQTDNVQNIWKNKEFLMKKQIEEQIMCLKVNNREILKAQSPNKSMQKQNFISQYFYGNPSSNNLVTSQQSFQSNNNLQSPSITQSQNLGQQPVFSMKLNSLRSPLSNNLQNQNGNSQIKSSFANSLVNTQYSNTNNNNYNNNNEDINNEQDKLKQSYQSSVQFQGPIQDVDQNIKQQYEQLLIHVDQQEKVLSQLDEEKKIFQEQLDNIEKINGRKHIKNQKNQYDKDNKKDSKNNLQKEQGIKQQGKGIQIWKIIILLIFAFFVGWYMGEYQQQNQDNHLNAKYQEF